MPQPDLAASIKATRARAVSNDAKNDAPATPEPVRLASPEPRRPAAEPTRALGTRVANSVHGQLADYLDRANRLARKKGLKPYTQRELVELALRSLFERDPATLL